MEFFSKLLALGVKEYTLKVIAKDTNNATVIVVPKATAKDTALQNLKPLSLTGKITELDNEFFKTIEKPILKTAEFFANVNAYEKQQQKVEEETKMQKEKNKILSENKTKITKILENNDLNPTTKNTKIKPLIEQMLKIDPKNNFVAETKKELMKMTSTIEMKF